MFQTNSIVTHYLNRMSTSSCRRSDETLPSRSLRILIHCEVLQDEFPNSKTERSRKRSKELRYKATAAQVDSRSAHYEVWETLAL